jgi:hypothetical protein
MMIGGAAWLLRLRQRGSGVPAPATR